MDWTYHVKISTEAGSGITNSLQELSTTQQQASDSFKEAVEFLNGEAFTEIILNALLEHLEKRDKEEDDKKIEEHLTSIIESIQQVQAGIITLMDLKEGDFSNVLDSFRQASESLDSGRIEDAIVNMFKKEVGQFSSDELMEKVMNLYSDLPYSVGTESDDLYINKNSENILTGKFSEKPSNTFADIIDEFQEALPIKVYAELKKHLNNLGKESGQELFSNILDWEGEKMKDAKGNTALYFIKKQMKDFLKTRNDLRDAVKIGRAPQSALDEYNKSPKSQFDFGKQGHWDDLKAAFKTGFIKNLLKDKDSPFQDKTVLAAAMTLMDDFFDITQEKIIKTMNVSHRKKPPSVEGTYKDVSNDLESFDFEKIQENLNQIMMGEDDPFELERFKEEFNDIFKKSQLTANTGDNPDVDLEGILKKNLDEAGFKESLTFPISKIVTALFSKDFEGANTVRDQIEELFTDLTGTEEISVTETLNKNLKEVVDKIDKTLVEFKESKDGKTLPNITEIDFDGFFAKSLVNDELISDTIMFTKQTIVNAINNTATQLNTNINRAIGLIGNLKAVRNKSNVPATSIQLSSVINEE